MSYNMKISILLFILVGLFIKKNKKNECIYIAHGCGTIENHKGTNSLEAFHQSYYRGFKYIEIDLLVTIDNYLIGGHDWNYLKHLLKYNSNNINYYEKIKHLKILNKYNLIDDKTINMLLSKYKDVKIFIDKLTNYRLLKNLSNYYERLYIEVFSFKQYNTCKNLGFSNVMLNVIDQNKLNTLLYSKLKRISAITISPNIFYCCKSKLAKLYKKKIKIFAYLINNDTDIKNAFCKYVNGFYVD